MNTDFLHDLLTDLTAVAPRPFETILIGGSAMMAHGLQDETKDVDLMFTGPADRATFIEGTLARDFGAIDDPANQAATAGDRSIMLVRPDATVIDCFLRRTTHFTAPPGLVARATPWITSGESTVRLASLLDLLVLKSATGRSTDSAIALRILDGTTIDWEVLHAALAEQAADGNPRAFPDFALLMEEASAWHLTPPGFARRLWRRIEADFSEMVSRAERQPADGSR
ncbi:MAG TPA: hypothetical protein VGG25_13745 [Streptosporangiaceae bacterium]